MTLWENLWRGDDYVGRTERSTTGRGTIVQSLVPPSASSSTSTCRTTPTFAAPLVAVDRCDWSGSRLPTLLVVADRDEMVPPANSEPIPAMLGSKDVEVLRVSAGHAGALMGSPAAKVTMPGVIAWLQNRVMPVAA